MEHELNAKAFAHIYTHELATLEADCARTDADRVTCSKALHQLQSELEASLERERLLAEAAEADQAANAKHTHTLNTRSEAAETNADALKHKLVALEAECAYFTAERTDYAEGLNQLQLQLDASAERERMLAETAAADRTACAIARQQLLLEREQWTRDSHAWKHMLTQEQYECDKLKRAHADSWHSAQQSSAECEQNCAAFHRCLEVIVKMRFTIIEQHDMLQRQGIRLPVDLHETCKQLCIPRLPIYTHIQACMIRNSALWPLSHTLQLGAYA
jgi:hypothetical protein